MVVAVECEMNGLSSAEYQRKLSAFEARIDRGEKIEPADWMPDEYRRQLIRLIHVHANSEICGALPEGKWIPHAPTFKRKMALCPKGQDEVGHARLPYGAAAFLGRREEKIEDVLIGGTTISSIVFHPPAEWGADAAIIGWMIAAAS